MPRDLRPAFAALWNLDMAFADVVTTTSDPRLGAIRMAWWRERLDELDDGRQVPAEPRLQAAARELIERGIKGRELSTLEDGWLPLLEPVPWNEPQIEGLKQRGRVLFGIGARLLGGSDAEVAGEIWSLVDGANHCTECASRSGLLREAARLTAHLPQRIEGKLRSLTILGALAASDASGSGRLDRLRAAILHRLTGRFYGSGISR